MMSTTASSATAAGPVADDDARDARPDVHAYGGWRRRRRRRIRCQNDGKSCDGCSWIAPPGYRAQSEGTAATRGEIFAWCGGGLTDDEPSPATPRPTVKPTVAAPTPRPTPRPQSDGGSGEGRRCFWPEGPGGCGGCGQCTSPADPTNDGVARNFIFHTGKECVEDCGHRACDGYRLVIDDGGDPETDDRATCDHPEAGAPVDATGFAREHGKLRLDGVQLADAKAPACSSWACRATASACYTFDAIEHLVKTWVEIKYRAPHAIDAIRSSLSSHTGQNVGHHRLPGGDVRRRRRVCPWTRRSSRRSRTSSRGRSHLVSTASSTGTSSRPATRTRPRTRAPSDFWKEMATLYKGEDHVIYEIANEPNNVAWSRVRDYHNEVISAIRAIDKESIIIAGTTTWSQDIHLAAEDPVAEPYNVMYAFHFYACSHGSLLQRVKDTARRYLSVQSGARRPTAATAASASARPRSSSTSSRTRTAPAA